MIPAYCHLLMMITPQGVQESSYNSFCLIDSFHNIMEFVAVTSDLNLQNLTERPGTPPHCKLHHFGKREVTFAVWGTTQSSHKKCISPDGH